MPTFCEQFNIPLSQAEVDFVNIDLETDKPLYICPYAIEIRDDDWSAACGEAIRSFFTAIISNLRDGNDAGVTHLLSHLHEPNETHLGESNGLPRGAGLGLEKAQRLANALRNSRAYQTGLLTDISEAELFIHGVGRDTISDLTTNIIRGLLAKYTKEQCDLHNVPVQEVRRIGPVWIPEQANWQARPLFLPVHDNKPILLVPKSCVRLRMSIDAQEFYNHHMIEFLQEEYLHAGGALVETLKNGNRRVTKKSVKEVHPLLKDDLASFVQRHPEVLQNYKEMQGAKGPLENYQLEEGFNEGVFAAALSQRLGRVQVGRDAAGEYHNISLGICTFLFHPDLTNPVKEFEQHEGRKRVDIVFNNAARDGFFYRMMAAPQTRSLSVFLECKNYSKEIANPELDQLQGRFSIRKGRFGILLCRSMDDRNQIYRSCRDTALDDRGFIMPLDDADLRHMLGLVEQRNRHRISAYLDGIFDQVSR